MVLLRAYVLVYPFLTQIGTNKMVVDLANFYMAGQESWFPFDKDRLIGTCSLMNKCILQVKPYNLHFVHLHFSWQQAVQDKKQFVPAVAEEQSL